jgi:Chaperone of endosialidase
MLPSVQALGNNTTGGTNIGVGYKAGFNLTTGSNNIEIGSLGLAAESKTIRIGTQGTQTATYIAGVFASSVAGSAVVVSNTGKLGIVTSSARFKRDIHDMGGSSSGLMKLRPVTFRYKNDPDRIRQ